MARYATLKAERDEAVARAVEAERLSNVAEIQKLEAELALARAERDSLRERLEALDTRLVNVLDHVNGALACLGDAVDAGELA